MSFLKPVVVGAVMALAMLYMMHDAIMSGAATLTSGTITFALLHVAALALVSSLAFVFPPLRRFAKAHRPDRNHVLGMLLGMVAAASTAHVAMHGVL